MFAKILAVLGGFFEFANRIWRLFSKTPSEKREESRKEIREDMDEYRKTGRPKWD